MGSERKLNVGEDFSCELIFIPNYDDYCAPNQKKKAFRFEMHCLHLFSRPLRFQKLNKNIRVSTGHSLVKFRLES